jgi:hypothetical protein
MKIAIKLLAAFILINASACQKSLITNKNGPIVSIVSPSSSAKVARGEGRISAGSFNGTGFLLNLEIVTQDEINVTTAEGLNIRNTALLGDPNPNIPGLTVFFDCDLVKPDGGIIPKNTNLASLFNIAGTDDTPGAGVTIWAGWHVLESIPEDVNQFTISVSVKDRAGREGYDQIKVNVTTGTKIAASGQALTPAPTAIGGDGIDDADGPEVSMIAPRIPSSVSTGPTASPKPPSNASLFFIQVSAVDKTRAGIGVNENGDGKPDADRGTILDGTQSSIGPNRFMPGLDVTFDVPLLQPNGNIIAAGGNLAPVFNIAGSEVEPSGLVRTTFGWVVGGSLLMPAGKTFVTIKSKVTDNAGKTGSATSVVQISPVVNGQDLTPNN